MDAARERLKRQIDRISKMPAGPNITKLKEIANRTFSQQ
jgi:hypothetical protein